MMVSLPAGLSLYMRHDSVAQACIHMDQRRSVDHAFRICHNALSQSRGSQRQDLQIDLHLDLDVV